MAGGDSSVWILDLILASENHSLPHMNRVAETLSRIWDRRIKGPSNHNPTLPQANGAPTLGDLISGNLHGRVTSMAESVYKVIELVGTSEESWEKAASAAVQQASGTLRDLRIAEVVELDLQIEDGVVKTYRAKVKVSFKLRPRP